MRCLIPIHFRIRAHETFVAYPMGMSQMSQMGTSHLAENDYPRIGNIADHVFHRYQPVVSICHSGCVTKRLQQLSEDSVKLAIHIR